MHWKLRAAIACCLASALAACEAAPGDSAGPEPAESITSATTATAATTSNTWSAKQATLLPWREASAAATLDGRVYLTGGRFEDFTPTSRVNAYDLGTDAWSRIPNMPVSRYTPNGASVINGKLYVSGGFNVNRVGTRALFVYDPATRTWTRKADVPQISCGGAQAVIGGQLYVYTGCYARNVPGGVLFRYDPAANTWLRRKAPPTDHWGGSGAVINGKFYLHGGSTPGCGDGGCDAVSSALHRYDPSSDSWTTRAPDPFLINGESAVALNGKLYLAGGQSEFTSYMLVYDPATNTWAQKAGLPTVSGVAAIVAGKIVYVSARDNLSNPMVKVYVYTP
jgi:N-acetylneuraminic acid mutarotase